MPTTDRRVIDGSRGDEARLVAALRDAFRDEPAQRWLFPNRHVRTLASHLWFTAMLRGARERGRVWYLADWTAVAVWFPPEAGEEWTGPAVAGLRLLLKLVPGGEERMHVLDLALRARRPPEPHWHLAAVATRESARGAGRGRLVLAPGLAVTDEARLPAFLETSEPRSLPFYLRLGFRVCDSFRPPAGPEIWGMLRDARSGGSDGRLPE